MRKKRPKSRAKSGAQSAAREISAQQPVAQSPVSKEHGFIGVPKPRRCCASRSGSRAVKFTKSMGPFVREGTLFGKPSLLPRAVRHYSVFGFGVIARAGLPSLL